MTKKSVIIVLALLALSAGIASADQFTFSYNSVADNSVTASGIITAASEGGGAYLITGIAGTRNGLPFSFVPNPDPQQYAVDNLLIVPANPAFLSATAFSGFVISTINGTFNPWYAPNTNFGATPGDYYEYSAGQAVPGPQIDFTASAIPEPGALSLLFTMLAGVGGLAGVLKKKLT